MIKSKSVEEYIELKSEWKELLFTLRDIIISTGLEETIKWGGPVYTYLKKNIIGIGAFKNFVALWFYNGVFLKDQDKKLVNAQEGVTKSLRQWRFTDYEEMAKNSELIQQYIFEAIEIEKQGKSIKPTRTQKVILPNELSSKLQRNVKFKNAFELFSKAKQREFAEYIEQAKRSETRLNRLDKVIVLVLKGEGLNDKYKQK